MRAFLVFAAVVGIVVAAAKPDAKQEAGVARSVLTCGSHTLAEGSYTISSPNHPADYENHYDCTYSLAPAEGVGSFSVECSSFELESHWRCRYDWLKVGRSKYCGTAGPSSTLLGAIDVKFHSDYSVVRPGFQCTITARPGSVATELACGTHTLTPGLYSIKSPNFPAKYGNGFDCAYSITPGSGVSTMTLACCSFDVEANTSCSWDWLQVNGEKYCGRQGPALSEDGDFNIAFHTDGSVKRAGFYCEVRATG